MAETRQPLALRTLTAVIAMHPAAAIRWTCGRGRRRRCPHPLPPVTTSTEAHRSLSLPLQLCFLAVGNLHCLTAAVYMSGRVLAGELGKKVCEQAICASCLS